MKVVQVVEGSDEQFCGYNGYAEVFRVERSTFILVRSTFQRLAELDRGRGSWFGKCYLNLKYTLTLFLEHRKTENPLERRSGFLGSQKTSLL